MIPYSSRIVNEIFPGVVRVRSHISSILWKVHSANLKKLLATYLSSGIYLPHDSAYSGKNTNRFCMNYNRRSFQSRTTLGCPRSGPGRPAKTQESFSHHCVHRRGAGGVSIVEDKQLERQIFGESDTAENVVRPCSYFTSVSNRKRKFSLLFFLLCALL